MTTCHNAVSLRARQLQYDSSDVLRHVSNVTTHTRRRWLTFKWISRAVRVFGIRPTWTRSFNFYIASCTAKRGFPPNENSRFRVTRQCIGVLRSLLLFHRTYRTTKTKLRPGLDCTDKLNKIIYWWTDLFFLSIINTETEQCFNIYI